MRIDNMIQSLRVLAKADALIAEAAFKARLSEIALRGLALCICVFGLVMIGIAVFFALQDLWGTIWAAAAVGLGSFVLSGLLVAFSSYRRPGPDLRIAHEMHKIALDSLVDEARTAGSDFAGVRGLFSGMTAGTLLGILVPVATLLLRKLKRSTNETPAP